MGRRQGVSSMSNKTNQIIQKNQTNLQEGALLTGAKSLPVLLILYLLGIFMGAIDTGIVTPARTLIQGALGVDDKTGIWMITIYTLAYASIIPISGKLADRYGRKIVYLISITLFGLGSAICALSAYTGDFALMLLGRVIQAIGGGGIMPIATAEFGTTFPANKRGMALGLVGGVYGIANIIGASAGSAILDIFGKARWDLIFLVNVPIAVLIVIAGIFFLPNTKVEKTKKIDWAGIPVLTIIILSVMYGLKNIDFFNFISSIQSVNVFPFLLTALILLPLFYFIEKKAEDPILAFEYFINPSTRITLLLAFVSGILMMGMVFVPQLSENVLRIASGSGGYFVAVLGLFAGVSAPLSGSLIDKFGAKRILFTGFAISLLGALFLLFVTIPFPSVFTVMTGLAVMGFGLGFTMGTPLNYMMLENTNKEESNSALATLSLIRSIGTAIAPAILIGFIAHAGMESQTNLMKMLPKVETPKIELLDTLNVQLDALNENPSVKQMMNGMQIPSFAAPKNMELSMSASNTSASKLPPELVAKLRSADVTSITDRVKEMASFMFDANTPTVISQIQTGTRMGKMKFEEGLIKLDSAMQKMPFIPVSMQETRRQLSEVIATMSALDAEVPIAFEKSKQEYLKKIELNRTKIDAEFQNTLNGGFEQMYITVAIASILAALILLFYKKQSPKVKGKF